MDRVQTRTDALLHPEISTYDPNGNLKTVTDRKNQLPTYTYDPLEMLPTLQTPEGRVLFSREPPPHERRYECAHRGRYGS